MKKPVQVVNKSIYLYITPFFPSPTSWVGGYCLDAVKAIMHDGRYDVRVVLTDDGADYEWAGVSVLRVKRISAPSGTIPFLLDSFNNRLLKRKLVQLGVSLDSVAVVHANTLTCGHYAAYLRKINPRITSIIQFHSSYSLHLDSGRLGLVPIHATLLYIYYRSICRKVDVLAFVSEMSRRTFGKMYVGNPEGEIRDVRSQLLFGKWFPSLELPRQEVVYNGVDRALFHPKKSGHEGFVIGCVANFQPLKDHITLLKAVNLLRSRIPGLKVRLVGSGQTLKTCKEYVTEHDLEGIVKFEKEVDHRDLPDFYRSLDLFVLPSRLEGFVCVCVESWACGTPSIFCENISLSELVPEEEKDKWLFRPTDEYDLCEKILAFRRDRFEQHFTRDLEINGIWHGFLDRISHQYVQQ